MRVTEKFKKLMTENEETNKNLIKYLFFCTWNPQKVWGCDRLFIFD